MDISCPNCSKRYRVDDAQIPTSGRKVRCRQCSHEFMVRREVDPPVSTEPSAIETGTDDGVTNDGGTVRISQDQIAASIAKMNAAQQEMPGEGSAAAEDLDEGPSIPLAGEDDVSEQAGIPVASEGPAFGDMPSAAQSAPEEETRDSDEMRHHYKVRIEGKEYTGLSLGDLKDWIKEDRLLENDEVAREGSHNWMRAEVVPDLHQVFSLHVYHQRKKFEEGDNPYDRFRERQQSQSVSGGGLLGKLKSLFKG